MYLFLRSPTLITKYQQIGCSVYKTMTPLNTFYYGVCSVCYNIMRPFGSLWSRCEGADIIIILISHELWNAHRFIAPTHAPIVSNRRPFALPLLISADNPHSEQSRLAISISCQDEWRRADQRHAVRQETVTDAQVLSLQKPRLRVPPERPQALLQLEGLPVSEMQTHRRETAGHGCPGNLYTPDTLDKTMKGQIES